jgi:hypothetical protein
MIGAHMHQAHINCTRNAQAQHKNGHAAEPPCLTMLDAAFKRQARAARARSPGTGKIQKHAPVFELMPTFHLRPTLSFKHTQANLATATTLLTHHSPTHCSPPAVSLHHAKPGLRHLQSRRAEPNPTSRGAEQGRRRRLLPALCGNSVISCAGLHLTPSPCCKRGLFDRTRVLCSLLHPLHIDNEEPKGERRETYRATAAGAQKGGMTRTGE